MIFYNIKTAMANWFENNPTKSVLSYTLIVATATWAVSTYVLQDNRLNLLRSEMEAQKSVAEQYKSKVELLQRDLDVVRSENAEYRHWLGQTKDAIPVIAPRIADLKQQVSELKEAISKTSSNGDAINASSRRVGTAKLGTAYIDESTGLIFTVLEITPERTARVAVKLPENKAQFEARVIPGQQWRFRFKGAEFTLTVKSIFFIADAIDLEIASVK